MTAAAPPSIGSPTGGRRAPIDPRLVRRVGAVRAWLAVSVAIGLGLTACLVIQALLLAQVLASLMRPGSGLDQIAPDLAGVAAAGLVRAGLLALGATAGARAASTVRARLRHDALGAVLARGPSWIAGERAGELAVTLGPGVDALDAYVGEFLPRLVLAVLAPVALLGVVAALDWLSLVILVIALALVPVFMVLVGRLTEARMARRWGALTRLGAHFLDAVEGLATLRAYGRARRQERQIATVSEELRRATMAVLRQAFLSSLVLETIAAVSTALVAVPLALRLLDGHLALAPALAVLVVTPEIFLPVRQASADFHAAAGGLQAADRVFDILDGAENHTPTEHDHPAAHDHPATHDHPAALEPRGSRTGAGRHAVDRGRRRHDVAPGNDVAMLGADVAFDAITVTRGNPSAAVVDHIDLHVPAGGRVALVGPSGAGKSTLCSALLGLVPVAGGAVTVGGLRHDRTDPVTWHRLFAYVPQDPHLFAGSLLDNLLLGSAGAGPGDVEQAIVAAQLTELVCSLPAGLDTALGARGERLSTGERQRVALARALLRRDAPVVVLDEPSAHLDTVTERAVAEALDGLIGTRTLLVATHRRRLLDLVDRTVTLAGGRLVADVGAVELRPAGTRPRATLPGSSSTAPPDADRPGPAGKRSSRPLEPAPPPAPRTAPPPAPRTARP